MLAEPSSFVLIIDLFDKVFKYELWGYSGPNLNHPAYNSVIW